MSVLSKIIKRIAPSRGRRGLSRQERAAEKTVDKFQELLGIRFNRRELLMQALTHRSAMAGEGTTGNGMESNERLEFLGDSILGLVVNEHLFHKYPNHREGILTQMKSLWRRRA